MHLRSLLTGQVVAAGLLLPTLSCLAADPQETIVVTATRTEARANELLADVTVIERDAIERMGRGSVADLLARQPGVQVFSLGGTGSQTDFIVRGARSEQTKILVDGVPINSMDVKGSPLRFLPLHDIERIEILRGPASAIYGSDAIGGVIQIFTRRAAPGLHADLYAGTGSYRTDKQSAAVSFASDRLSGRVFGGDERSKGFSSVRNATKTDADADGYINRSAGGNLALRVAPGHELAVSGLSSRGMAQYDGSTGDGTYDSRYMFKNEVWNLSSRDSLTDSWDSTLRWGNSLDEQNSYTSALASGYSPLRTTNRTIGWQNDVRLPLGQGLVLLERQDQHAAPVTRFTSVNKTALNAVQLGWNASSGAHRWQVGGRRDRHDQFGSHSTGTASYGYQIDPRWRAHAVAGSTFRAPTLYQLYAGITGSLVANPLLQPETGRSAEAGLVYADGVHNLSFVAYRNRVSNMIDFDSPTKSYRNISRARLSGWTLAYQGAVAGWNLNASVDGLDPVDEVTGLRLGRRAREKATFAADRGIGDWNIGAEWLLVGRRFNRDTETQPMGGYGLLNLTAKWQIDPRFALEVRGDNVTNKTYTSAMTSTGAFSYATPGATLFAGLRASF